MIKFVIGDVAVDNSARYRVTTLGGGVMAALPTAAKGPVDLVHAVPAKYRDLPWIPSLADMANLPHRTFEFQRGSAGGEIQWLVNGMPFIPTVPMALPVQSVTNPLTSDASKKVIDGEVWTIKNGGGGWVHPVHFHMEEHRITTRTGGMAADDNSKEDVVALGPSESVSFYRRFRTFTGPYVAHCHNLAHEDHAMMFGWNIIKK
jgi:FtsP/CotA-like multicopper oxidase with cupredoxin domain